MRVTETVRTKQATNMPTAERLKELLSYSPETGEFTWRFNKGRAFAGSVAGGANGLGYWLIRIDGHLCLGHRLAWLYVHGELPPGDLDHINQIKGDNRIENLRVASRSENEQNKRRRADNTSGYRGVCWNKLKARWMARICLHGKCRNLGYFETAESAYAAYLDAAAQLHTHNPLTLNGGC